MRGSLTDVGVFMSVMQTEIMDRTGKIVHILFIVDITVIVPMAMRVLAVISRITRVIANATRINSQVLVLFKECSTQ